MDEELLEFEEPGISQDQRAELGRGALVCLIVVVLLAMIAKRPSVVRELLESR